MAKIIWTETAIKDIDDIADYIAVDSSFYAKQFVQTLFAAALKLENYPEIGKIVRELPGHSYREILFKKYRSFTGSQTMRFIL